MKIKIKIYKTHKSHNNKYDINKHILDEDTNTNIQGVPKKKETFFEHLPQERALNISSKNSI